MRSIVNFTAALGGDLNIRICCLDRDEFDEAPYPGMKYLPWEQIGRGRVRYLRPGKQVLLEILRTLKEKPHDTLYLSGGFDPYFSIWPLVACWLGLCPRRTVVIAPCGELAPSALAIKPTKKKIFLAAARFLGLHKSVVWHATTAAEAQDIQAATHVPMRNVRVAGIVPTILHADKDVLARGAQQPLRVIYLSKICRMKNLAFGLKALRHVRHSVRFSIFGLIEEKDYWAECEKLIADLPAHVEAVYGGPIPYEDVPHVLAEQDLFLLPTLGENFGHVIFEALEMGLPIIISDKTPWQSLRQAGVGYDIPLEEEAAFTRAIDEIAEMPAEDFIAMRERAFDYARDWLKSQESIVAIRRLLSDPRAQD